MIKLSFITSLHEAFPNATISDPFMNASYLFDKNKKMIGHLDYSSEEFYLNKNYKYIKEAKHVLDKNEILFEEKSYNEAEILYN